MGQIFDRFKFVARSYLNAAAKKIRQITGTRKRYSGVTIEERPESEDESIQDDLDKLREEINEKAEICIPEIDKYLKILGIRSQKDLDNIAKIRKDLLKQYHPDRFTDPKEREEATRTTASINEAYDKIKSYLYNKNT